jgi:hypothetical protein
MDSDRLKEEIFKNASEITRLHSRIHETLPFRGDSPAKREAWERACVEFHARYDELSFPGGFNGALERIVSGDTEAMEAAICFLECRPYFFRSGYMFKDILRKCKRAPLSEEQTLRLNVILEKVEEWRRRKASQSRR